MTSRELHAKIALFEKCQNALNMRPEKLGGLFSPGRIEFLGKHTDYAGGRSLVCAIERGLCSIFSPRDDKLVRVVDAANPKNFIEYEFRSDLSPTIGHWSNYPMIVARRIAQNFSGELRGANIALASDLPMAAGLSSSSSLVVAIFLILSSVNDLTNRPEYLANIHSDEDLAGYLGSVENGLSFGALRGDRGVGTRGGSQDQTAILCSRPNRLSQYSWLPVRRERDVPLPADHVFVIGASGVVAEKTGPAMELYNRVSRSAAEILSEWNQKASRADQTLAAAMRSSADAPDEIRAILKPSPQLLDRFDQFFEETEIIVPAAGEALIRKDLPALKRWVARSQELAETKLKNQIPQTMRLAKLAHDCGATAASAFGAGFGGSVWSLVPRNLSESFLNDWREKYLHEFPRQADRAEFFVTSASAAAMVLPG